MKAAITYLAAVAITISLMAPVAHYVRGEIGKINAAMAAKHEIVR